MYIFSYVMAIMALLIYLMFHKARKKNVATFNCYNSQLPVAMYIAVVANVI